MKISTIRRATAAVAITLALTSLAACGNGGGSATSAKANDAAECAMSEELIEAARDEGAVTIYSGGHQREALEALERDMKENFGVTVTSVREDSEAVVRMVQSEIASGSVNVDVVGLSDVAAMAQLASDGVLTDAELPNADEIREGIDDPSTPQVAYAATPLGLVHNSSKDIDLPKSWDELLEFDGTIAVAGPDTSGTSLIFFSLLQDKLGKDWMTKLSKADVTVTDSSLALAQLVLTGEADIAIPGIEPAVLAAAAGGEPIAITYPDGGVPTMYVEIGVMKDAPHPNAAKLLTQYQLCRSFQEWIGEQGGRSVLNDPPPAKGVADLSGNEELTPVLAEIAGGAADLREQFVREFK